MYLYLSYLSYFMNDNRICFVQDHEQECEDLSQYGKYCPRNSVPDHTKQRKSKLRIEVAKIEQLEPCQTSWI